MREARVSGGAQPCTLISKAKATAIPKRDQRHAMQHPFEAFSLPKNPNLSLGHFYVMRVNIRFTASARQTVRLGDFIGF